MGASEEVIAAIEAAERQEDMDVAIWPENWTSVLAFSDVMSQWHQLAMPNGKVRYTGLNYAGVRARLDTRLTDELWADIQIMERAAIEAANAR